MSTNYTFVGISLFCLGMMGSNIHKMQNKDQEVVLLKHEVALHQGEAQILRDQIADMAYQFSNKRTYEQGLMDGINNSKNEDFVRGYHAGVEQFSSAPNESITSK